MFCLVLLRFVSGELRLFLLYFTVKCLFWETVGSLSVTCRSSVGGLSVACRPTDDRQSVEGSSSSQSPILLIYLIRMCRMSVYNLKLHLTL